MLLPLLLATALSATSAEPPPEFSAPIDAGLMAEPADREASGLAASHRAPDLVWTHSDSGRPPVLYAMDLAGERRGRILLEGIPNIDWEDLSSFALDGKAWLLVADCGDNRRERRNCVLHVVEEPVPASLAPDEELRVRPAWSLPFVYEDGPRDCEAVAVDPAARTVFLLSKREYPARLYQLPLQPAAADKPLTARFVGEVRHVPQPNEIQMKIKAPQFAYRGSVTGMDFSPDGRLAAVLSYGDVLLFPRAADEPWAAALARKPVELRGHQLPQAEAICFVRDGHSLLVCSEETMRWVRYDRREK